MYNNNLFSLFLSCFIFITLPFPFLPFLFHVYCLLFFLPSVRVSYVLLFYFFSFPFLCIAPFFSLSLHVYYCSLISLFIYVYCSLLFSLPFMCVLLFFHFPSVEVYCSLFSLPLVSVLPIFHFLSMYVYCFLFSSLPFWVYYSFFYSLPLLCITVLSSLFLSNV